MQTLGREVDGHLDEYREVDGFERDYRGQYEEHLIEVDNPKSDGKERPAEKDGVKDERGDRTHPPREGKRCFLHLILLHGASIAPRGKGGVSHRVDLHFSGFLICFSHYGKDSYHRRRS